MKTIGGTRRAILVLGMHRSGTSALSGALVHLGVAPPRSLMPATGENERGYFESTAFMAFHDTILAAAGSCWNDWRPLAFPDETALESGFRSRAIALLETEFGDARVFVLKDPRACRMVPFWMRTLEFAGIAPHVLIPFRSPQEVTGSLAARDRHMPPGEGVALWLRHALDAEYDSRGVARSFVGMDDLLSDWRGTVARIARDLGMPWPIDPEHAAAGIDGFLSHSLKHHRSDVRPVSANWAGRVFDAFTTLAENPAAQAAQAALDETRSAFDQACSLLGAHGHFVQSLPRGAQDDVAGRDNRRRDGAWDDVTAARQQARLWTLAAQARDLRRSLESLSDRAGVMVE